MRNLIDRRVEKQIRTALHSVPSVVIAGPRQIGKTTLAEEIGKDFDALYFDLSLPSDRAEMQQPETALAPRANRLTIIDEVQFKPDLFQVLRPMIDARRKLGRDTAQFLLLGSAGSDNLGQAGETLTGRTMRISMQGFDCLEIPEEQVHKLWSRGSFPPHFLAGTQKLSRSLCKNYANSYFDTKDRPLGMYQLLKHIANSQGGIANKKKWGGDLEIIESKVALYLEGLEDLFLIRSLQPYSTNLKKRIVKTPKYYIRDSGLMHALRSVALPDPDKLDTLSSQHNIWNWIGPSWEGFVIENMCGVLGKDAQPYFYRTHNGEEIDFVVEFEDGDIWAIEIKYDVSRKLTGGNLRALKNLNPQEAFRVHSGTDEQGVSGSARAVSLRTMMKELQNKIDQTA